MWEKIKEEQLNFEENYAKYLMSLKEYSTLKKEFYQSILMTIYSVLKRISTKSQISINILK